MLDGKQKAVAAFLITLVGSAVTYVITQWPDDPDIQKWGAVISAVITIILTTAGVYETTNTPKEITHEGV